MQVTPYQEDEVVLVCSRQHQLAQQQEVTPEQLSQLHFVSLFSSSTVESIHSKLEQHGINWKRLQVALVRGVSVLSFVVARSHHALASSKLLSRQT